MSFYVSDFLDGRIAEIAQNLLKTNSAYALAVEKRKDLYHTLHPIISRQPEITLSAGDCMDFKEFLEHEFTSTAILQLELCKQGYLDCVKLLGMLGVLA